MQLLFDEWMDGEILVCQTCKQEVTTDRNRSSALPGTKAAGKDSGGVKDSEQSVDIDAPHVHTSQPCPQCSALLRKCLEIALAFRVYLPKRS